MVGEVVERLLVWFRRELERELVTEKEMYKPRPDVPPHIFAGNFSNYGIHASMLRQSTPEYDVLPDATHAVHV